MPNLVPGTEPPKISPISTPPTTATGTNGIGINPVQTTVPAPITPATPPASPFLQPAMPSEIRDGKAVITTTPVAPTNAPEGQEGAFWNGRNWEKPPATPETIVKSGESTPPSVTTPPDTGLTVPGQNQRQLDEAALNAYFDQNNLSPEERQAWIGGYFKDDKTLRDFITKSPQEQASELAAISQANTLTRDASIKAERLKSEYDRQVEDSVAQYELQNLKMKNQIAADANNMAMVAGTSGRLTSQNMVNSISSQLDMNKRVYDEMVRSNDSYMKAVADTYKANQNAVSNEYNDKMGTFKKDMLAKIEGLQSTGAMNTRSGLLQARQFIDAYVSNGAMAMEEFYNKSVQSNAEFEMRTKQYKEENAYSKDITEQMNDGYLHTVSGGLMAGQDGQPIKVKGNTTGELMSKEIYSDADGSKYMIFKDVGPDGKTVLRKEMVEGTESAKFDMPEQMLQTYSTLYSGGKLKVDEMIKLGITPEQIMNIIGNASAAPAADWERTTIKVTDPVTGEEREKIVFTNKKGEIKDPGTGEISNGSGITSATSGKPSGYMNEPMVDTGAKDGYGKPIQLKQSLVSPFQQAVNELKSKGINLQIQDANRSQAAQKVAYDKWVAGGKKGPNVAPPGKSFHAEGQAFDLKQTEYMKDPIVRQTLEKYGFKAIPGEWWHYSVGEVNSAPGITPAKTDISLSDEKAFSSFDGTNFEQLAKNITGKTKVNNVDIRNAKDKYNTYLSSAKDRLSPEEEQMVSSLQSYDLDPNKLPGGMSKEGQAAKKRILAAAFKDPNYDMKKYPAKAAAYKDWNVATGTANKNNNAIVTVTGHMMDLAPALEALSNGNLTKFNELWNKAAQFTGAPEPTNAKAIAQAVASEMAKVYKGNASPTEEEIKEWSSIIGTSVSPKQAKDLLKTLSHLMVSKVKANATSYARVMEERPENIFDQKQTKFLQSQGVNPYEVYSSKKGSYNYPDKSKIEFDGKGKYRYTAPGQKEPSAWTQEGTGAKASEVQKKTSLNATLNTMPGFRGTKTVSPKTVSPTYKSPQDEAELNSILGM